MWSDPTGMLEEGDPVPFIQGKEVVVYGKAKSPQPASFNYSLIDWSSVDNSKRPTLGQYNKHHGTSYQSFDEYYNFEHYQPALKKQTQSIHNATGSVAKILLTSAVVLTGSAYALPLLAAVSPSIQSTIATVVTNPLVQEGALNMTLNAGSQYIANGGVAGGINMIEVASSGVPGTNLIPTVVGETFSLTAKEGFQTPDSFSKWSVQVGGGILSNRFGKATDCYLGGEGIGGKITSEYFKTIIETGSNAAPNLVD